ncbi:MAG: homoserine kinase [Nocardioidaceae bacterium]|nr:homoserine kinase [Nocardioidaceae bacterium]
MADLVGRCAAARSPATSANLGPGFDSFGLALGLYDDFEVTLVRAGLEIDVEGEGAELVPRDESHLVVTAMRAAFDRLGARQPGLRLRCRNRVPHGRGLGSSASAIVSGVVLARALAESAREPSDEDMLGLAAEIEGHPDNVAACMLGGFTLAWTTDQGVRALRLEPHPGLRPVVFVPPAPVATDVARGLLPAGVSHRDASVNAAHAGLLVAAITSRPDLLLEASSDLLHQEFRRPAMPVSLALVDAIRSEGSPAVLSGAGPAVLALATADAAVDVPRWTPPGWRALRLEISPVGCAVTSAR